MKIEMIFFCSFTGITFLVLTMGWLFESMKVCDEYVAFTWMSAPRALQGAACMLLVCVVLLDVPSEIASMVSIIGWSICCCELVRVLSQCHLMYAKCIALKRLYHAFEEHALLSVDNIPDYDFVKVVNAIISRWDGKDDYSITYFIKKCEKLAKRIGIEWEA